MIGNNEWAAQLGAPMIRVRESETLQKETISARGGDVIHGLQSSHLGGGTVTTSRIRVVQQRKRTQYEYCSLECDAIPALRPEATSTSAAAGRPWNYPGLMSQP